MGILCCYILSALTGLFDKLVALASLTADNVASSRTSAACLAN